MMMTTENAAVINEFMEMFIDFDFDNTQRTTRIFFATEVGQIIETSVSVLEEENNGWEENVYCTVCGYLDPWDEDIHFDCQTVLTNQETYWGSYNEEVYGDCETESYISGYTTDETFKTQDEDQVIQNAIEQDRIQVYSDPADNLRRIFEGEFKMSFLPDYCQYETFIYFCDVNNQNLLDITMTPEIFDVISECWFLTKDIMEVDQSYVYSVQQCFATIPNAYNRFICLTFNIYEHDLILSTLDSVMNNYTEDYGFKPNFMYLTFACALARIIFWMDDPVVGQQFTALYPVFRKTLEDIFIWHKDGTQINWDFIIPTDFLVEAQADFDLTELAKAIESELSLDEEFELEKVFEHVLEQRKKRFNKIGPMVFKAIADAKSQMGLMDIKLESDTKDTAMHAINALNAFSSVLSSINDTISTGGKSDLSKSFDRVNTILKNVSETDIDDVTRNTVKNVMKEVEKSISSQVSNVMSNVKKISLIIGACGSLLNYIRYPSNRNMIMAGICIGAMLIFTDVMNTQGMMDWVSTFLPKIVEIKPAEVVSNFLSYDNLDLGISAVTALLNVVLSCYSTNIPLNLFKSLSSFGRTKAGLTEFCMMIFTTVENIFNWLKLKLFGGDTVRFLVTNRPYIDELTKEITTLLDMNARKELVVNESNYLKICGIIVSARKLISSLGRDNSSREFVKLLWKDLASMEKLKLYFDSSNFSLGGARQEAVGLCVGGGPGTGKSIIIQAAAHALCAMKLDPEKFKEFQESPNSFFHNRQFETGYWDGYVKQFVTFFDDFGQNMDVAGNADNEYMNIIRGVNGFEYNLHMSDISDKGNTMMRSSFIMVSTNERIFSPKSIRHKEALDRRFAVRVVTYPKEKYCLDKSKDIWKRKYDFSKVPEAYVKTVDGVKKISTFNADLAWFVDVDGDANVVSAPYEFDELIRRLSDEYDKRADWFAYQKEYFKTVTEKYRPLYPATAQMAVMELPAFNGMYENETKEGLSFAQDFGILHPDMEFYESIKWILVNFRYDDMTCRRNMRKLAHMLYPHEDFEKCSFTLILINIGSSFPVVMDNEEELTDEEWNGYFEEAFRHIRKFEYEGTKMPFYYPNPRFVYNQPQVYRHYFEEMWNFAKQGDTLGVIETYHNLLAAKPWFNTLVTFVSSVVFIKVWEGIFKYFKGSEEGETCEPEAEPQSMGMSDKLRVKVPTKANYASRSDYIKSLANGATAQMASHVDPSGCQLVKSIIAKNFYKVERQLTEDTWEHISHMLMIGGQLALMPYHYITRFVILVEKDNRNIKQKLKCTKKNGHNVYDFIVTVGDILAGHKVGELVENDLVLVQLPKHVPMHRDISSNFAMRKDYRHNVNNLNMMLPTIDEKYNVEYWTGYCTARDDTLVVKGDEVYAVRDSYQYSGNTGNGDCGAPLCVMNSHIPNRKIFGIHVAGHVDNGVGFSSEICQEDLLSDMEMFDKLITMEDGDVIPNADITFPYVAKLNVIGNVSKSPNRPFKSEIMRSKLHSTYHTPITAPARLKPKINKETKEIIPGTNPVENTFSKFNIDTAFIDYDILEEISTYYWSWLHSVSVRKVKPRLLTWEEAVFGIEDEEDFNRINPKSSPGYPENMEKERSLKKRLFFITDRNSPEFYEVWDECVEAFEAFEAKYFLNIRPMCLNTDNWKDERRKLLRVLMADTRLFSGAWWIYLTVFRKYFGVFQIYYNKNRVFNGSAVGVNPFSDEWDLITKNLKEVNPELNNVIAGDYKAFDISEITQFHNVILDGVNEWYDDEFKQIRELLWLELSNSRHVLDGIVYELNYALPSGHAFTPYANTIYGHLTMRYVYYRATDEFYSFHLNVRLIQCGDDHVATVSDKKKDVFNEQTIPVFMKEIGLAYTKETKEEAITLVRSITEIEFLKRAFVWDEYANRYIAPLRLEVILETPCWVTKQDFISNGVAANVENSIRELSLHSEEIYNKWSKLILWSFEKNYQGVYLSPDIRIKHFYMRNSVLKLEGYFRG